MDCLIQEIRVADLDLALVHVSGFGDCQIIGFPRIEDEADHLESGFCQNWMIPIQRLLDALLGVFRFGRRDMRDKFYYAMWNWIRRYWRNIGKAKDIAPQTAAAYERALDKQVEEVADLKYRLSSLTQWRDIQADPKWGFATDDAIDEIFRNLPRLVRDKRDGSIELIDYDNAAEWRGDLERKPSLYQWLPINGNTL